LLAMNDNAVCLVDRSSDCIAGKHRSHGAGDQRYRGVPGGPQRLVRGQASLQQVRRCSVGASLLAMNDNAVCLVDRDCIAGKHRSHGAGDQR
jgi:hypothetical protein